MECNICKGRGKRESEDQSEWVNTTQYNTCPLCKGTGKSPIFCPTCRQKIKTNIEWKKELPSSSGWYWFRYPNEERFKNHSHEPVVVQIRTYGNRLVMGNTPITDHPAFTVAEWAGPIPLPEEYSNRERT